MALRSTVVCPQPDHVLHWTCLVHDNPVNCVKSSKAVMLSLKFLLKFWLRGKVVWRAVCQWTYWCDEASYWPCCRCQTSVSPCVWRSQWVSYFLYLVMELLVWFYPLPAMKPFPPCFLTNSWVQWSTFLARHILVYWCYRAIRCCWLHTRWNLAK